MADPEVQRSKELETQGAGAPDLQREQQQTEQSMRGRALNFRAPVPTGKPGGLRKGGLFPRGHHTQNCNPYTGKSSPDNWPVPPVNQQQGRAHEGGPGLRAQVQTILMRGPGGKHQRSIGRRLQAAQQVKGGTNPVEQQQLTWDKTQQNRFS